MDFAFLGKCDRKIYFWRLFIMKRKTTKLRELFASDDLLVVSSCYDALSAIIQQEAGLRCIGLSGNTSSASRARQARPGHHDPHRDDDARARAINEVIDIPMLADADTGFGGVQQHHADRPGFRVRGLRGHPH